MNNRTKDEIIDSMVDTIPFELPSGARPYIKEAMDIYLAQELSKLSQQEVMKNNYSFCNCRLPSTFANDKTKCWGCGKSINQNV